MARIISNDNSSITIPWVVRDRGTFSRACLSLAEGQAPPLLVDQCGALGGQHFVPLQLVPQGALRSLGGVSEAGPSLRAEAFPAQPLAGGAAAFFAPRTPPPYRALLDERICKGSMGGRRAEEVCRRVDANGGIQPGRIATPCHGRRLHGPGSRCTTPPPPPATANPRTHK